MLRELSTDFRLHQVHNDIHVRPHISLLAAAVVRAVRCLTVVQPDVYEVGLAVGGGGEVDLDDEL